MKNLLLLLVMMLLFTSCVGERKVKVVSTDEKTLVADYDNLYSTGDTIVLARGTQSTNWHIDENWYKDKKDTVIGVITYRVATVIR